MSRRSTSHPRGTVPGIDRTRRRPRRRSALSPLVAELEDRSSPSGMTALTSAARPAATAEASVGGGTGLDRPRRPIAA